MTDTIPDDFAGACAALVGQIAVNPPLSNAIVEAVAVGDLRPDSGPLGISKALKGYPGSYNLKEFLDVWAASASHLDSRDITTTLRAAIACYRLARDRSHIVDSVWTGPEVARSEVRRTEPVVTEIVESAGTELLIVGYWLVTRALEVRALIERLVKKSEAGVQVRFVFDPGEKSEGLDNFAALSGLWPDDGVRAPRQVYSWSEGLTKLSSKSGQRYERKLHAKVIVADRHDALVTSANLTRAGLLENLEMGLRVQGSMAASVVRHFDLLIDEGILEARA